jgi:ubiquinone/menaquinone biosynthesis methyltransferase
MHADPLSSRKREVPSDFDRVARRYDLLTGMNPGYSKHLRWSAERLAARPDARLLDLCCGTGLSTAQLQRVYPTASIDALDASAGMLDVARKKPALRKVSFLLGDAMAPAAAGATGPYDGILMAYGIRNMPDRDQALAGVLSLLAPGGTVCFHEYSVADSFRASLTWKLVSSAIIVPSGRLFSGEARIYEYLRESVLAFDGVSAFTQRLRAAGFTDVHVEPMDGWQRGILHSFIARRPA